MPQVNPDEFLNLFLICFTVIGGIVVIGLIIFGILLVRSNSDNTKAFIDVIGRDNNGIKLATVVVVVFAALAMSLVDKLNDGLIAILSSIVGYVLGGLHRKSEKESTT